MSEGCDTGGSTANPVSCESHSVHSEVAAVASSRCAAPFGDALTGKSMLRVRLSGHCDRLAERMGPHRADHSADRCFRTTKPHPSQVTSGCRGNARRSARKRDLARPACARAAHPRWHLRPTMELSHADKPSPTTIAHRATGVECQISKNARTRCAALASQTPRSPK